MSITCREGEQFPGRGGVLACSALSQGTRVHAENTQRASPDCRHFPSQLQGLTSPGITQHAGSRLSGRRELTLPYLELHY